MQNADFGQILCGRATSRPTVRFSQTWYQKMRKTWKKKVMKRHVAICGGREAVTDFVQGGGQIAPPPPVKIGLKCMCVLNVQQLWMCMLCVCVCVCVCVYVRACYMSLAKIIINTVL